MTHLFYVLAAITMIACSSTDTWKSYTKNKEIETKVTDLLNKMTLEEKIGQMTQFASPGQLTTGSTVDPNMADYIKKGEVGSILNAVGVDVIYNLQKMAVEQSRLGIPILFGLDVVHGYKTIFPIPLAEACSWNLELMEKTARVAAIEASAGGIHWTFAPMVDISRDPRWGRVMEGAGEDTYLGGLIAKARVKGFQGKLKDSTEILACAKHFAAYGAAEAGRDYNTAELSDHTLFNYYLPPYLAAQQAGVATFMTAFNEINGIPCTNNRWLFDDVLRKQWGFNGLVVTDYTAINETVEHGNVTDEADAAVKALKAGVDMDMQGKAYLNNLKQAVTEGKVTEQEINLATARILEMKFLLGLFDNPYRFLDREREKATMENPDFLATAKQMAKESIVLLKNNNNVLPLSVNKKQTIAVIGPMAEEKRSLNGEWAGVGDRAKSITLQQGLSTVLQGNTNVEVVYEKGCDIMGTDQGRFPQAVRAAQRADVVILAMGEDFNMTGEAASFSNITLPGVQRALVTTITNLKKPTVLVLMNGRPLDISEESQRVDAVLETWYLGRMAGEAIAEVLIGKHNPSGKLVMSFPRNVGQVPVYYNHKNTGRPLRPDNPKEDYRSKFDDIPNTPLYPFGYGLSYTSFAVKEVKQDKSTLLSGNDSIVVTATVENTGNYDGETVIQLYIRDKAGSVTRPMKELKGFHKIKLEKGEQRIVRFVIQEEMLRFYNADLQYVSEPGDFQVWIAEHAEDNRSPLAFRLL